MEITLSQWLESHGLSKYLDALLDNDIDSIRLVATLSADDLKELGVSLGDRKRFGLAIEQLASPNPELSQDDLALVNSLPYVIAYPLKQTLLEKHAWTRINLFKDTFLNYLKYLGLLSASEFFSSELKDRGMVALFHQNLTETAFGKWNHYIREVLKFLKQNNHHFFCPELLAYYETIETGSKAVKYKGEIEFIDANGDLQLKKQEATAIGMLINFRNRYLGHGLTLDADASEKIWQEYFPIFRTLLEKMNFAQAYPMHKIEDGESWILHAAEITRSENTGIKDENIWMQNPEGKYLSILPFFIVPGELAVANMDKAKVFAYESYTGKTIKFFSPEGTEKQTSGKILERLNLLLREKQKESPFSPDQFDKDTFLKRIEEENAILLDTLVSERKIIPGVYQHREQMEIKLREWIGARANIFFIAAEAGSGKTNLLAEMQRQYTGGGYPTLLIRAGRMEKTSLQTQVAYLLNIDAALGLHSYGTISGSQSEPTIILIDGLNEARESESIWREILDWSKSIDPGSIKFVITSRANSKSDLERFALSEDEYDLLYGETKENEKGLDAHVFWLTPMDMKEMKGAWESYLTKDKSRFKPLFSFDDLATFDRGLYDQISNPLVLRLFLEVYNGKPLPKKGGKHLHIWQDWFNTFSAEEQTFLRLLTDEVWLKGSNELLLDDLLQHENLKPYLSSDLVNSPYARMKNLGWLSRYMKDMNACLGFTVEGSLLFLLGKKLQQQVPVIDDAYIRNVLSNGKKLQRSAIESFLCEQALAGNLDLLTVLIDADVEYMDICVKPLLYILKSKGVEYTIDKILNHPTENDWKMIIKLYGHLDDLELDDLMKEISKQIILVQNVKLVDLSSMFLITVLPYLEYSLSKNVISELESRNLDKDDIESLAFYYTFHENPSRAIEIYNELYDIWNLDKPEKINKIAAAYDMSNSKDIAFKLYESALKIALENKNLYKKTLPMIYFNIARLDKIFETSLDFYNKSLESEIELYGSLHKQVLLTKNAIYVFLIYNKKPELAEKIIDDIKVFVNKGFKSEQTNDILGSYYYHKGNHEEALKYYEEKLKSKLEKYGELSIEIIEPLKNIANCYDELFEYRKGLDCYDKIYSLIQGSIGANYNIQFDCYLNLAYFNFHLEEYDKVIFYSNEIRKNINYAEFYNIKKNKNVIHYNWAYSYYELDKYDDTIEILNEIIDYDLETISEENYIENNRLMAHAYYCLADYKKAIDFYTRSLMISESNETIYGLTSRIALCYEEDGQIEMAIEFNLKCLELLDINNDKPQISLIYFRIGSCYENIHKYEISINYYKKGFDLDAKDNFLFRIANCYEAMGNYTKSFEINLQFFNLYQEYFESNQDKSDFEKMIQKTKHWALDLGRENELPDWMV